MLARNIPGRYRSYSVHCLPDGELLRAWHKCADRVHPGHARKMVAKMKELGIPQVRAEASKPTTSPRIRTPPQNLNPDPT